MASPPPLQLPPQSNPSADYYYFVATVAIIAIMLIVSNMVAFACCSSCTNYVQNFRRFFRKPQVVVDSRSSELIPVSKYKKDKAYNTECSVCLTGFTEGEEVRQLPQCKHSYHAPCIDMWLYSHSSCPVCRSIIIGLPPLQRCPRADERILRPPRRPLFTESVSPSMSQVVVAIV